MKTAAARLSIALLGNPNTGKSTIFSALAGVRQRVGNYPGVTVEKKVGQFEHAGARLSLIDLPGTYSLAPRSPDEMVAVDVLLGRREDTPQPDVVLCIVDASNLERNLYLVSQALELGLPVVLALNMTDVAAARGTKIDVPALAERLGVPVVELQAHKRIGLEELKAALASAAQQQRAATESPFPPAFNAEVAGLHQWLGAHRAGHAEAAQWPRYLVERLLLDTSGYLEASLNRLAPPDWPAQLLAARERLAAANCPVPAVEAIARYGWVGRVLDQIVQRRSERVVTWSDRLDHFLTSRVLGTLCFTLLMVFVFQAVFRWAEPPMGWIESLVAWIGERVGSLLAEGPLRSLLTDGVIAGVGGVLVFLPQIMILFFFIGVLEDCGYMARAAFLMDKLMTRVGLSGKSFIPLLSSFACAIPGVMATRVIENRRDRMTTILVAPLMSCSARIPVYVLLTSAFIPQRTYLGGLLDLRGLTTAAMYALGIVAAVLVALILKRTVFRGPTPPFVLELPPYKIPSLRTVLYRVLDRAWAFIHRAGTLILAVSILVWAAAYYPRPAEVAAPFAPQREALAAQLATAPPGAETDALQTQLAELEAELDGAYQRQSWLARWGRGIEPAVRPLGWDWRIGAAAIASFPAREVVVSTLGIIYNVGGDVDVEDEGASQRLRDSLRAARWDDTGEPVFSVPTALSLMVFFSLCAQCAATLAVIRRETNSLLWPTVTFAYMTVLAYVAALATYQVGMRV